VNLQLVRRAAARIGPLDPGLSRDARADPRATRERITCIVRI
jgi:hypothetical protein